MSTPRGGVQTAFIILFSIFATSATNARAADAVNFTHTCGSDRAGDFNYNWCIDKAPGSRNRDVLYSYHGLRGNAETWYTDTHGKAISAEIAKLTDVPTIISISFGDAWLITDLPSPQGHESMESVIVNQIMPKLEARAGFVNGRRLILGISMGGFNAGQLALKEKGLFNDAILMCPVLQTVGPFSSQSDVDAAIARQGPSVDRNNYLGALNWMKSTFPDPASWARHDLLSMAKNLNARSIPIYLTTGRQDEYGFFEGATAFAGYASAAGAPIEWRPIDGHHCSYDASLIAAHLYGH